MSSHNNMRLASVTVALLGCLNLVSCADIYHDRRETISFAAGDAIAANKAVQTIDPWPAASADRNITISGEKIQGAIERYRTGNIIQPNGSGTGSSYGDQASSPSGGAPSNSTNGITR